jgi:hypothetical protein
MNTAEMIARLAERLQGDFTLAERLRLEDFFGVLWDELEGAAMHFADRYRIGCA